MRMYFGRTSASLASRKNPRWRRFLAGFAAGACWCMQVSAQAPEDAGQNDDAAVSGEVANACPPPDGTRPDPTLVNTDPFVLARFPLQRVFEQLVKLAHVRRLRPVELYQQLWDAMDVRAEGKFYGPHCDDTNPPTINGFPIECPRPEATLKDSLPSIFAPVALMNRFDLSPKDGANCGEYRMIYAMPEGEDGSRNLIIFEGVLANPDPSCGIEACRPVVNFWESLASYDPNTDAGRRALADQLERFYFSGLPGFSPVIHPSQFGMQGRGGYGGHNGGQIRTNMFIAAENWQLRELRLKRTCIGGRCRLRFEPVSVKLNPFPPFFNLLDPTPDPRAADFQAFFPTQVESLIHDDVNLITMQDDDRFNAGQSTSQISPQGTSEDDYLTQALRGLANGPNTLTRAIRAELERLGRDKEITPLDVVERAATQSCAGCHMLTRNVPLSGDGLAGPVWPDTRPEGFVHVDEHGFLSPALWCSFLPFRKSVLDRFAASPAHACREKRSSRSAVARDLESAAPADSSSPPLTISGKPFGPN